MKQGGLQENDGTARGSRQPAELPREYFMVRKEAEGFADRLPWGLGPKQLRQNR
jgi:hypothetical protein